MMKKVLSVIFIAIIIAHVFLSVKTELNEKPDLSLSIVLAMADGGNGENDPPDPPVDPIPDSVLPDSTSVYIIP